MGVRPHPRGSRSRRLWERISSGRRAPVGDWKRHGGLRESAGIPALQQLRSVVNPTGRNPTSPLWFALLKLCKVSGDLVLEREWVVASFHGLYQDPRGGHETVTDQ